MSLCYSKNGKYQMSVVRPFINATFLGKFYLSGRGNNSCDEIHLVMLKSLQQDEFDRRPL